MQEREQEQEQEQEQGERRPQPGRSALQELVRGLRQPIPLPAAGGVPEWVQIPAGMGMPKGRQVLFLRFRASWTDTPGAGDRQAILWALSDADEKLAIGRAMTDPNRISGEMAKQMVRAIDGHEVDHSGVPGPGNLDRWWDEIGSRCRSQIVRLYTQLHVLDEEAQRDFFESCIAVRTAG